MRKTDMFRHEKTNTDTTHFLRVGGSIGSNKLLSFIHGIATDKTKWIICFYFGFCIQLIGTMTLLGLSHILEWCLVLICLLVLVASAANNDRVDGHVFMEKQIPRSSFVKGKRSDPNSVHEVVIAINKQNLDLLEIETLERASPESPKYQQWLTYDEVTTMVQNLPAFEAVQSWLKEEQLKVNWISPRKDYIKVSTHVKNWERLLKTEFYEYSDFSLPQNKFQQRSKSHSIHRAVEYSIPSNLHGHIFAIFNTVQTPPVFAPKYHTSDSDREDLGEKFRTDVLLTPAETIKHLRKPLQSQKLASTPVTINGYVTVAFLNHYYQIVTNNGSSPYSQSVFETSTEYFSPSDLTKFQKYFNLHEQAAQSIGSHSIATCPVQSTNTVSCNEGNLDIQYIMGVSQVTASIFWWVASSPYDPFVLWITSVAGETNPPRSNSISWGAVEQLESVSILQTFNNEAMQLAAMGVTIVASSGDDGVANLSSTGVCSTQCTSDSSSSIVPWTVTNSWTGLGYFPNFPATSPYVTAAGATQGPEEFAPEIACQSQKGGVITTGGGFSTYFSTPSWQTKTVNKYFQSLTKQPVAGYNRQGRGIPDISLVGAKYVIALGNTFQSVYGTSCTAPVFAAFVSLINAQRHREGRSTLGWLNPTLYSYGYNQSIHLATTNNAKFNDIISGNNSCCANSDQSKAHCCASGFVTTAGWDPVTGWGSVNFTELASMFNTSFSSIQTSETGSSNSSSSNSGSSGGSSSLLSSGAVAAIAVVMVLLGVATLIVLIWFREYVCSCCFFGESSYESNTSSKKYIPSDEIIHEGSSKTTHAGSSSSPSPLPSVQMSSVSSSKTRSGIATDVTANENQQKMKISSLNMKNSEETTRKSVSVAEPSWARSMRIEKSTLPLNSTTVHTTQPTKNQFSDKKISNNESDVSPMKKNNIPSPSSQSTSTSVAPPPPPPPSLPRSISLNAAAATASLPKDDNTFHTIYERTLQQHDNIKVSNNPLMSMKRTTSTSSNNTSNRDSQSGSARNSEDRNSMQRVEMLQRGLGSFDRTLSGNGTPGSMGGRGAGRPIKPARPDSGPKNPNNT